MVTAIAEQANKAALYIGEKWNNGPLGQFCQKATNSISDFYEEHKNAINIAIGIGTIVLCGAALAAVTAATAGTTCCIWLTAMQAAYAGSIGGSVIGAAEGAVNGAFSYMEEHGTLDGAGSAIWGGATQGFAMGAVTGAVEGFVGGFVAHKLKPKCFVAGTLILTSFGFVCIENIRPGDYVYAKNEETGEQEYMPVLEVYENEIDATYTVTIDGESIETTAGHPFYTTNEGWIGADELEAGDNVELSDGSSGTVESVERNEHDEPVTIYNFNVMDYHTYYVGEKEVLVHNSADLGCTPIVDVDDVTDTLETPINSGTSRPRDNATPNSIYEQLNPDGSVKSRAFYDEKGNQFNRQDFDHSHFDKKTQQYYQPHEHSYHYNKNGFRDGVWDGPLTPGYNNLPTK